MANYFVSLAGTLRPSGVIVPHASSSPTTFPTYNVPSYTDVRFFTGDADVPRDIYNQRVASLEVMQRMGTPVMLKRVYNAEDAELGVAVAAPTFDTVYNQSTYAVDQLSHGIGYVSVDTQDGEWYDPLTGKLYLSPTLPNPTYLPAPRYRGYGPGFLTYAILPDRPEDTWKLTPQGTLIRQQIAMAQLPWWPQVGDNDLLITCQVGVTGLITRTYERYQLKRVTPITMRGLDRMGERESEVNAGGNRFWVGQQCELAKIPTNDPTYQVEVDR